MAANTKDPSGRPLAWCLFVLCVLAGAAYAGKAFLFGRAVFSPAFLCFHGGFSLTLVLLGAGFVRYYPFNRFCFLASMLALAFLYGGFVMAFWFRTAPARETVTLVHAVIFLIMTLWKLGFKDIPFVARLPLSICNILVLFIIARPFWSRPLPVRLMLDNYIVCFGLTAAFMYFILGTFFDDTSETGSFGRGFFYYRMAESSLLHNVFLGYCVYAVMTGLITVDVKSTMTNMLWIIPAFFLFVFLNQLWKTDYFFTGTYGATPDLLIRLYRFWPLRFTLPLGRHAFEVNPVHSLVIISAAAAVLLAVSAALALLQDPAIAAFQRIIP